MRLGSLVKILTSEGKLLAPKPKILGFGVKFLSSNPKRLACLKGILKMPYKNISSFFFLHFSFLSLVLFIDLRTQKSNFLF